MTCAPGRSNAAKRTRHLIELGGLIVKSGVVELTGDDRAVILGALLWMVDKLRSDDGQRARQLWAGKGKESFDAERNERKEPALVEPHNTLHDGA